MVFNPNLLPGELDRVGKRFNFVLEVPRRAYVVHTHVTYGTKRAKAILEHVPDEELVLLRFEKHAHAVSFYKTLVDNFAVKSLEYRIFKAPKNKA